MKLFNKSPMSASIALALAVSAGAVVGLTAPQTASASRLSPSGEGQALIFPYYTVRDGFRTLFNVTNTSGNTIAVKVRFREGRNSRDVLDFNLIMSPYDVWTGFLTDSDAGPVLTSSDRTCTSPNLRDPANPNSTIQNGWLLSDAAYASFSDRNDTADTADATGSAPSIDRLREGYVELIMMGHTSDSTSAAPADTTYPFAMGNGQGLGTFTDELGLVVNLGLGQAAPASGSLPANPLAYYAKHVPSGTSGDPDGDMVPRDCAKVAQMFQARDNGQIDSTDLAAAGDALDSIRDNPSGSPQAALALNTAIDSRITPLKGNFTFINSDGDNNTAGGSDAIAIDLWTATSAADPDPDADRPITAEGDGDLLKQTNRRNASTGGNSVDLLWARTPYDFDDNSTSGDGNARDADGVYVPNLVTAQEYPYFNEPTLASAWGLWSVDELINPLVIDRGDTANRGFNPRSGSVSILRALQTNVMNNEWATRPTDTGAETDWVITMPLKNFFVDAPNDDLNSATGVENNFNAAINAARGYGAGASPLDPVAVPVVVAQNLANDDDDISTAADLFDQIRVVRPKFAGVSYVDEVGNMSINTNAVQGTLPNIYNASSVPFQITIPEFVDLFRLVPAFDEPFGADGRSSVALAFDLYDREEGVQEILSGDTVSPSVPGEGRSTTLDYEVNVVSFESFRPLSSELTAVVNPDTSGTFGSRGWMSAQLQDVPAVGFVWKYRTGGGNANGNYSQVLPHGTGNEGAVGFVLPLFDTPLSDADAN